MRITVRESPLKPPLIDTDKATWGEIRDQEGWLALLFIFPPGKSTVLVVSKDDRQFAETIQAFNVPLHVPPATPQP